VRAAQPRPTTTIVSKHMVAKHVTLAQPICKRI
jgi:hypothetical protein